jgi:SOS-response transcriptional repressor LexA
MSQTALAAAVGVTQGAISQVERGTEPSMAGKTVAKIERALSLPAGSLARHLPADHAARQLAGVEVPNRGIVWGGPPAAADDGDGEGTFRLVGRWPADTYVLRVRGWSVEGYGVHDGDVIAVRPSDEQEEGALVVARQGGAYTLKGCRGGKLIGFARDGAEVEVDAREPYQVVGVMIGLVDGERRYTRRPRLKAGPPAKPKKKR